LRASIRRIERVAISVQIPRNVVFLARSTPKYTAGDQLYLGLDSFDYGYGQGSDEFWRQYELFCASPVTKSAMEINFRKYVTKYETWKAKQIKNKSKKKNIIMRIK